MNKMKLKTIVIVGFLFCSLSSFAENWKTVPDVFTTQCKKSFIDKVNKGSISLQELASNSQSFWIVYSDRENNRLKNRPNGSNNGSILEYMEPLYIKEVRDNWLHVYGFEDEDEKGWIEAKYLLLSHYSLKTEGDVSVPRKAIILTSLDQMIEGNVDMDDVLKQKHYYHQPQPKKGTEQGTPNSFTIMFVMKEQDGSVLLANTDVLNSSVFINKKKVFGWMPKSNITKWNSRVALEPARSADAISEYSGEKLPGYKDLNKLESCIKDNFCDKNERFVEFKVEEIRSNRMRKPILSSLNDNVREIVSIAKNSSELGEDQVEIYNDILDKLNRKSQMTNVVFAVDATASMRPYFSAVARSINKIIENNERLNQHELKFGLVVYRDYADGNDAFSYEPLNTDFQKIQNSVNNTVCQSRDKDLPEAQYNGLIKGVNALNLDPNESNVVILIGDCGNHSPDPRGVDIYDVIKVFHKNNINLISYQVKSDDDDSYFKFNEDALDFITITAEKIIEDKETTLKVSLKNIGNNTYKLDMAQSENDFENMFGRFIYANANKAMNPIYLEESIVETLSEYMKSVDRNIGILIDRLSGTGGPLIDTDIPPEGVIVHIMDKLDCSREDAIDFLNKTEVTTKAFVAIDYHGNGVDAQVPVVFLTENEKNTLIKSLRTLNSNECVTRAEKKKCLQENLIRVCKSILGPKTSTETIEKFSMQEVWKIIIGIDFEDEELRDVKLRDFIDIGKRDFDRFYDNFMNKSKDFCDKGYEHSNLFKSRRFSLFDSYFYWIPLEDLPGTN